VFPPLLLLQRAPIKAAAITPPHRTSVFTRISMPSMETGKSLADHPFIAG
jgi:hypothetical protein